MDTDFEAWKRDWRIAAGDIDARDRLKLHWLSSPKHGRYEAITAAGDEATWGEALEVMGYADKYGPSGWVIAMASLSIGHERSHTRVSWRVVWITNDEAYRRMTVRQQRPRGGAKCSSMT